MQKCCFYASIQKQPLIGHYFMFMGLLVSLGPWRQLYLFLVYIWTCCCVFVELGSFCHTCRFIVNLTLNRAMDLSGGAPLLLDTFMLRWSTLIGYLHAGPINYSYIRSIYLYWKHAIPVACRAVLCCSTVVLYFHFHCSFHCSCCCSTVVLSCTFPFTVI